VIVCVVGYCLGSVWIANGGWIFHSVFGDADLGVN